MSDTGPGEMASIIKDEEKYRTWSFLTLVEIKSDLGNLKGNLNHHMADDKRQFDEASLSRQELKKSIAGISSNVGILRGYKDRLQGGWATVCIVAMMLAFVIDVALHFFGNFK